MPKGKDVMPKKWKDIIILFDDGIYSICWGKFENNPNTLGKRWNDNYPRQGSSPTWYIEYGLFAKSCITDLIKLYENKINISSQEVEYLENCKKAITDIETIYKY